MTCAWQVEIDPWARRVLAKHWPGVRRWDNIKTFIPDTASERCGAWGPWRTAARRQRRAKSAWITQWSVDLICGGFPCTDISCAGKRAGLAGKQSGLWYEFARIVRVIRPRFVLIENVSALLTRGLDSVLGTLASDGYDSEWACIPAASLGAPHIRDRVFIVAHSTCAHSKKWSSRSSYEKDAGPRNWIARSDSWNLRHFIDPRPEEWSCFGGDARAKLQAAQRANCETGGCWEYDPADLSNPDTESGVGGMVDGVSARMDGSWKYTPRVASGIHDRANRFRGLGNAVVPQVAEFIGHRILEFGRDS